mmetsp:Transcript_8608/g.24216  ORF Transcript_8608/g.24216 Transcript_8608/m.24216 type:complete len:241 (-) Transcript_8608:1902-2624(-)
MARVVRRYPGHTRGRGATSSRQPSRTCAAQRLLQCAVAMAGLAGPWLPATGICPGKRRHHVDLAPGAWRLPALPQRRGRRYMPPEPPPSDSPLACRSLPPSEPLVSFGVPRLSLPWAEPFEAEPAEPEPCDLLVREPPPLPLPLSAVLPVAVEAPESPDVPGSAPQGSSACGLSKHWTRIWWPDTSCSSPAARIARTCSAFCMTMRPSPPGRVRIWPRASRKGFTLLVATRTRRTFPYLE